MSWAKPGVKCVCVDDAQRTQSEDAPRLLRKGQVYTVSAALWYRWPSGPGIGVHLCGITRPGIGAPWSCDRFRPLQEKPDAIEQFREIARGVSNGKPIIDDPMPTKRVLEEMTP